MDSIGSRRNGKTKGRLHSSPAFPPHDVHLCDVSIHLKRRTGRKEAAKGASMAAALCVSARGETPIPFVETACIGNMRQRARGNAFTHSHQTRVAVYASARAGKRRMNGSTVRQNPLCVSARGETPDLGECGLSPVSMRQRAGKRRGRVHEAGIRRNTRGSERQPPRVLQPCWWAIHFISMLAPRGSPFTSTTARAGLCPEKNFSYRALKSANREISVR